MVGTTISQYRVLEEVGAGGMGVVYLADDLRLNRKVALKFIGPEVHDDHAADRLRREARGIIALGQSDEQSLLLPVLVGPLGEE
jgi:serine/threonine protein kinase